MARTMLPVSRRQDYTDEYLGQIIIFCEGHTEKYYFDYFSEAISKTGTKYAGVVVETENAQGNARTVLKYANDFLSDAYNNRKFKDYGKYLVFDCDTSDTQEVINDAAKDGYNLLISNEFFETWLLMYFEEVAENEKMSKLKTYRCLSEHLYNRKYKKGRKGTVSYTCRFIWQCIYEK